mgnify:CR=1 FL=1
MIDVELILWIYALIWICIVYFIIQQLRMGLFGESLHWHSLNGPQAMETDM